MSTTIAFETRRDNLRRLILDKFDGNRAAFARAAGVNQNQINLLLSDNEQHRRNLGEALARRMEQAVGLPNGYFDLPRANGAMTHTVRSLAVPEQLQGILRRSDDVLGMHVSDASLNALKGKITAPENLIIAHVITHDMAPEIAMDETVVIDAAVNAITHDGIYIIHQGHNVFLRRVTKSISGGWTISSPNPAIETLKVDSLRGIKAAGRIVMTLKRSIL
jgi:hypothetical protein